MSARAESAWLIVVTDACASVAMPLDTCARSAAVWLKAWATRPMLSSVVTRSDLSLGLAASRSEEHTSELQSLMRISYAVFCLKKKKQKEHHTDEQIKITKT